jgi:hypothetical protein
MSFDSIGNHPVVRSRCAPHAGGQAEHCAQRTDLFQGLRLTRLGKGGSHNKTAVGLRATGLRALVVFILIARGRRLRVGLAQVQQHACGRAIAP